MAGILQAKKAGYPLDMEGFWLGDKFRIIAVIDTSAASRLVNGLIQAWARILFSSAQAGIRWGRALLINQRKSNP
jgi:hypothetical protein